MDLLGNPGVGGGVVGFCRCTSHLGEGPGFTLSGACKSQEKDVDQLVISCCESSQTQQPKRTKNDKDNDISG